MDFIPDPNEHIHFTEGTNPANKGKLLDLIVKISLVAAVAIGIYFAVKNILYKPPSEFDSNPFTLSCNEGTYFRPCSDDVYNSACCPCDDSANCPSAVPSKSFLEDFLKYEGFFYQVYFNYSNDKFNDQPCGECTPSAPGTT